MIVIAAALPAPAAAITWARGSMMLPGCPHAGHARAAGRVDGNESGFVEFDAEPIEQAVGAEDVRRTDEHGRARDHTTVLELDSCQMIVFDQEACDDSVDDPDSTRVELPALG